MVSTAIQVQVINNDEALAQAFQIRREVFIAEQNITEEEEFDGLDDESTHYLAKIAGVTAGTCRVRPLKDHPEGDVKIERISILKNYRGHGVGRKIVEKVLADIQKQGYKTVVLYGQSHATGFYQSFGFKAFGDEFMDARIPHRKMKIEL